MGAGPKLVLCSGRSFSVLGGHQGLNQPGKKTKVEPTWAKNEHATGQGRRGSSVFSHV